MTGYLNAASSQQAAAQLPERGADRHYRRPLRPADGHDVAGRLHCAGHHRSPTCGSIRTSTGPRSSKRSVSPVLRPGRGHGELRAVPQVSRSTNRSSTRQPAALPDLRRPSSCPIRFPLLSRSRAVQPARPLIMGFRQGFYPEYRAVGLDMDYLYGIAFLTLFAGMLVFTLSRRR